MRMLLLSLIAIACMSAEDAPYRAYLAYPTTLGEVVTWMDRDLGDSGPAVVAAIQAHLAKPSSSELFNDITTYAYHRFAYFSQRPNFLRGILANAATGGDWINGDTRELLYAYAAIKSGKTILGATFDPAKAFTYVPPKTAPIDPKQLDIK